MHRSGTSALTRVLNLAGSFLPEKLLPAIPGENDRGFWEPAALVAADKRAMTAAGVPWDSPRRIDPEWFNSEAAENAVIDLARVFEDEFSGQGLFVIKDPRLCRIVPLVLAALSRCRIEPAFVLILRHPSAVAASLMVRNAMPRGHARALWLRYMLDAERWTRSAPRLVISLDELMSDWKAALVRMSEKLGVELARGPKVEQAVAEFLEPALIHHSKQDDEPLPRLLGAAWSAFQHLQAGSDSPVVRGELDRLWQLLDDADEVLGAAFSREVALRVELEESCKAAERQLGSARREVDHLRRDLERHSATIASLAGTRDDLRAQLEAVRAELTHFHLQSRRKREELELNAKRFDEHMKFLQSMAQAALERKRDAGP